MGATRGGTMKHSGGNTAAAMAAAVSRASPHNEHRFPMAQESPGTLELRFPQRWGTRPNLKKYMNEAVV